MRIRPKQERHGVQQVGLTRERAKEIRGWLQGKLQTAQRQAGWHPVETELGQTNPRNPRMISSK